MLSAFIIGPIIFAVLLYLLPSDRSAKALSAAGQLALLCGCSYLFIASKRGTLISRIGGFKPAMGITLKADSLSSVFVLLASFIFFIVMLYNLGENDGKLSWFFLYLWQGLLNGLFLTGDVFNAFIFVEIVTVVVSVMIMFKRDKRSMYDGMLYLMVNTVAIQFYLFGIGYLYKLTGSLDMDMIAESLASLDRSELLLPYALIMTTISLKCALMPLFSWLPRAHGTPGAPSAVSAILSGLHIKSGLYLFIRFRHVFQSVNGDQFFLIIGVITGIAGAVLALAQSDIKLILAYSTISQIGVIMTGMSLNNPYAYAGAAYHIINHALFKSALFLGAGVISHAYGTRELGDIRGVSKKTPLVAVACALAILGITGAPLFNGSVSKYFIAKGAGSLVNAALILNNLGTITIFIKYSVMFFGSADARREAGENADTDVSAGASVARLADTSVGAGVSAGTDVDSGVNSDAGVSVARAVDSGADADVSAGSDYAPGARQQAAVLIPGLLCLAGGLFGRQFIYILFGFQVSIDPAAYLQKSLIFACSFVAGFIIYKLFLRNTNALSRVKSFSIGFRGICALIGAYFAILLISARFFI